MTSSATPVGKHSLSLDTGPRRPLFMAAMLASATAFGLIATGATVASSQSSNSVMPTTASSSIQRSTATAFTATASRSSARESLKGEASTSAVAPSSPSVSVSVDTTGGSWSLGDEMEIEIPYSKSTAEKAQDLMADQTAKDIEELKEKGEGSFVSNGELTLTADVVRELNKQYSGKEPEGWNPAHDTGDVGNMYSFSQCTWWAYKRRHELGLSAGSHMGDGRMWTGTGKTLGYWVSNEPHIGDAMSFPAGVMGSDPYYGHVAIVENVFEYNGKKYIKTSESGASYNGGHFSRIISNPERFEYLHY